MSHYNETNALFQPLPQTAMQFYEQGLALLQQSDIFLGHGYDCCENEAAALVLRSLDWLDAPEGQLHQTLTSQQQRILVGAFAQRIQQRIPTAYITQSINYAGIEFYVNADVLIPRSPFASLIESGFAALDLPTNKPLKLLDLCCGSGCIGIASLLHCESIKQLTLTDISAKALAVAQINVQKYHLAGQVKLQQSDLFRQLPAQTFDLIICNPPYVDEQEMTNLPREYRYEPDLGLRGKRLHSDVQDGLQLVQEILQQADDYLSTEGILLLEVGASITTFCQRYASLAFVELDLCAQQASNVQGMLFITAEELRRFKRER